MQSPADPHEAWAACLDKPICGHFWPFKTIKTISLVPLIDSGKPCLCWFHYRETKSCTHEKLSGFICGVSNDAFVNNSQKGSNQNNNACQAEVDVHDIYEILSHWIFFSVSQNHKILI